MLAHGGDVTHIQGESSHLNLSGNAFTNSEIYFFSDPKSRQVDS